VGVAVEAEDDVGDAVEHVAVVGDEDERSLELEQGFFEDLEGGDVEVVGGLVEHEQVGGLQHEARDEDAAALAAAEALDGLVELVAGEEELRGVAGDVDDAILVDDGVGVRREGAAQGEGWVDLAQLREVDDAQLPLARLMVPLVAGFRRTWRGGWSSCRCRWGRRGRASCRW
jgi:hypothetical protein